MIEFTAAQYSLCRMLAYGTRFVLGCKNIRYAHSETTIQLDVQSGYRASGFSWP